MDTRREFIHTAIKLLTGTGVLLSPLAWPFRRAYAGSRKILLPRGTTRASLIDKDPNTVDPANLELTPLKDFGTMGRSDFEVDLNKWRLGITGRVRTPLQLAYPEILSLSSVEKKVLLICPGFFANYGRWQGISMKEMLGKAVLENDVTHVVFFSATDAAYQRKFPLADVISNRVFLAYRVNGKPLPIKHGFPLRLVAEGYHGSDWVKYVSRISVEKT